MPSMTKIFLDKSTVMVFFSLSYTPCSWKNAVGEQLPNFITSSCGNKFDISTNSVTGAELFAFKLTPVGENFSITNLVYSLTGVKGFSTADLTNAVMNIDYGGDGTIGADDLQVGGAGAVSINSIAETGTITFSSSFTATTTRNYILRADATVIDPRDGFNVKLLSSNITSSGVTSAQAITTTGSLDLINHTRMPIGIVVGGSAPAGAGTVTGGGSGAGESIGNESGFMSPASTGSPTNQWATASNAYDITDGTYATETVAGEAQDYADFSLSVPAGNIIDGIQVKIEASGSTGAGTIDASLSWNTGTNVTSVKSTAVLSASDVVYTLGGSSDTWGRTWSGTEFSNTNF